MKRFLSQLTFWKVVAGLILLGSEYSTVVRFFGGLGAATNLWINSPGGFG